MKLFNIIKIAFKNIKSNKLRSALTMLGLIIGIASVIVLVGIGTGATDSVTSSVQSLGTNILTVKISSEDTSLTSSQMNDILELYNVEQVSPYKTISASASKGENTSNRASITATNNNYLDIINIDLAKGRPISQIDIENSSKVCILGYEIASTLFNLVEPVGEKIKLDGDNYTVIGVLTEQGTNMGTNIDEIILIPLTTAKFLGEDTSINNLYVKVQDENKISQTTTIIEDYIRENLQISSDYYSVSTQSNMIDAMSDINSTLTLLLGGIASISLIVGGIGVMNVMLVSVTERTREIGIRKALGARKIDILFQFLVESLVLSIIGGMLGVLLGFTLGNIAEEFGYSFSASKLITFIAFGASATIGLIFGIFPAYRASCLKPIDALKTE